MKIRCMFVLLLLFFRVYSQNIPYDRNNSVKDFPFQVLYSEGAKNKIGMRVDSLDFIPINDLIDLEEDGYISLIHYTGIVCELKGKANLIIKDISDKILQNENKSIKKNDFTLLRPNIEYLFLSNSKLARKNKLLNSRSCHDCNSELEIIYPPQFDMREILFSGDLCLKWRGTDSNKYRVELRFKTNKLFKMYSATKNEILIPYDELSLIKKKELIFYVTVVDDSNNKMSDPIVLREYSNSSLGYTYQCELKSASAALMVGLYLELLPYNYQAEAEKYFILATRLSDKEFFKLMLANFEKRKIN